MSIYATVYAFDKHSGRYKLIKHLNQTRMDHYSWTAPGGWNKSGKKSRIMKNYHPPRNNNFTKRSKREE